MVERETFNLKAVGSSPTSSSILAYSVTVSTKHFDCVSLGSNPGKPTIIRVVEESGLSRWPWTLEHAGSNPAYPTRRLLLIHSPYVTTEA